MVTNMANENDINTPDSSDNADIAADTATAASGGKAPAVIAREVKRRRTFGIISHPDAGKTTLTEKLLLFSGAIQMAGTVKARKSGRHATSDWMEIEKQRGISVASSVMQFEFRAHVVQRSMGPQIRRKNWRHRHPVPNHYRIRRAGGRWLNQSLRTR